MSLNLTRKNRGITLMGKKRGMTQFFDEKGNAVACTVIEAEPNVVTQVKTERNDGYNAIQLGFEKITVNDPRTMANRCTKPLRGHYQKAGVDPRRYLGETRLASVEGYTNGQEISVSEFADVGFVDARAMSKGKGFQGVMKKFHFAGGPASHGSGFHRHAGSTGMRSTPGRCLPGGPRASHMGYERVTIQNIRVVAVYPEDNVILVEGQVPGPRNGLVHISPAIKKTPAKKNK
ncbi:MAG: 50S ribosomal protein L3 [Parachlamydiaceae bacterium]